MMIATPERPDERAPEQLEPDAPAPAQGAAGAPADAPAAEADVPAGGAPRRRKAHRKGARAAAAAEAEASAAAEGAAQTPTPAPAPSAPVRRCAVTRERLPQTAMIRFALGPDNTVVPDIAAKLPGRGAWVRAGRAALDAAEAGAVFNRAFKTRAIVPEGLADRVEGLALARVQMVLALAKKAGQLVLGEDNVRKVLEGGPAPAALLTAQDAGATGTRRVQSLAEALYGPLPVARALSAEEIGARLGRGPVVHALLRNGPLAKSWQEAYGRLSGLRPDRDAETGAGAGSGGASAGPAFAGGASAPARRNGSAAR